MAGRSVIAVTLHRTPQGIGMNPEIPDARISGIARRSYDKVP